MVRENVNKALLSLHRQMDLGRHYELYPSFRRQWQAALAAVQ